MSLVDELIAKHCGHCCGCPCEESEPDLVRAVVEEAIERCAVECDTMFEICDDPGIVEEAARITASSIGKRIRALKSEAK